MRTNASGEDFVPQPGRDAYAALRGFAYQVDTTLARWMVVGTNERLELECGEDIDLIARAFDADPSCAEQLDVVRTLEQVKHRETPFTLRSPEVRATLAHFHAHRASNPDLHLRLRYTTNALPGEERHSAVPTGIPAIVAWQSLREGTWTASDEVSLIVGLRNLIHAGKCPAGVSQSDWRAYQQFVASASFQDIRSFITDVEWSTGSPSAHALAPTIKGNLLRLGFAADGLEADGMYDRLFVYVWSVLTRSGVKQLSSNDLARELSRPTLTSHDRRRLQGLQTSLEEITKRVQQLEHAVGDVTHVQTLAMAQANARIDVLAREVGIQTSVTYRVSVPSLEEPPVVVPGTTRGVTVEQITTNFGALPWLAIHGASGTGKTQLALLFVRATAATRVWLDFRDLTPEEAAMRLDSAGRLLLGQSAVTPAARPEVSRMVGSLEAGSCIVLDDLPRYAAADELGKRVISLVSACRKSGVRIVTTSVHRAPVSVEHFLPPGTVAILPVPVFSPGEVREVLAAYGAPAAVLAVSVIAFVTSTTRGHPVLLQALVRDLARRGWPATIEEAFGALIGRAPDESLGDETFHRVLHTVEDQESRQLLARLTFVDGSFGIDDVRALADVASSIGQPRARLHGLTGLWVQAEARDRYVLSPLVRELGPIDVPFSTAQGCHIAVARRIVARSEISVVEFLQAFNHFVQGGEPNTAGILLLRAVSDYNRLRGPAAVSHLDLVFLSLWVGVPTPADLESTLLMQLRAAQISARRRAYLPVEELQAELDSLLERATEADAWAVFGTALFMLSGDISAESIRRDIKYVRLVFATWMAVDREWRARGLSGPPAGFTHLIWITVASIHSPTDLREWLDLVELIPDQLRDATFAVEVAYSGSVQAANALILSEEQLPESDRRWVDVLDALGEMERCANRIGSEVLWAAAIAARLRVVGENLRDMATAVREATIALEQHDISVDTQFLITKTIGFLFVDVDDLDSAESWLLRAEMAHSDMYAGQHVRATLWAAVAIGRHDATWAAVLASDAAAHAKEALEPDDLLIDTALSEAGLNCWFAGDRSKAFAHWSDTGQRLLERAQHDREAAARVLALLYPLAHFSSRVETGVPLALPNGDLGPRLERGVFLRARTTAEAALSAERTAGFAFLLTRLADALGNDAEAAAWATRAIDTAHTAGDMQTAALLVPVLAINAVESGDYASVLEQAISASQILHSLERPRGDRAIEMSGETVMFASGSPAERVSSLTQSTADHSAMALGLMPIVLKLAILAVEEAPSLHAEARRAAAACREISNAGSDPAAWREAADIIGKGFDEQIASRDLVSAAGRLTTEDSHIATALRSVAYLAATLDPLMTPADALRGHLALLPWAEPALANYPGLYRATLSRFLLSYWNRKFDRTRFRFTAPRSVESTLKSLAQILPTSQTRVQTRQLVECMTVALGVHPSPSATPWLRNLPTMQ